MDLPEELRLQLERDLESADEIQRALMEERVIITDYYDNPVCSGSKTESESLCVCACVFVCVLLSLLPSYLPSILLSVLRSFSSLVAQHS